MLNFYSGRFENWTLYVRDSFIQIQKTEIGYLYHTLTLHYDKGHYPEFQIDDYGEEKLIFKTPVYSLQITFEFNGTCTLQLLNSIDGKELLHLTGVPSILAEGLKDIGQDKQPAHGIVLIYDPFVLRDDSDSGYSTDERATFSDTSY